MIKTFIKRIWLTIVICVFMMMGGGLSANSLEWNLEAKKSKNVITIIVNSKNPTTVTGMEKVTKTLEKGLKSLKGVDYISSYTDSHKSEIEILLKPEASMVDSLKEVGNIVVTAKKPDYVKAPVVQKSSKSENALISLNVYGKNISLDNVTQSAKDVIKSKIEKIDGVSYVEIKGEPKQEVVIKFNQYKLSTYGITIDDIRKAFAIYNNEKGFSARQNSVNEFPVLGKSSIQNLQDIKNVIVDFRKMIKLSDVADINFANKDFLNENWVNGDTRVVSIKIFKTNDGNPLKTSQEIMKVLNQWIEKNDLIAEVEDNSQEIRTFFKKTQKTFIEAIVIVLAVVILFLGSIKSSITPILAIPISLIATFLPMKLTGCSINVSTLMAFLLAIGLVVDDAILVVENISKHHMQGKSLKIAAADGTEEIKVPIIIMTLTLACVFLPAIVSKGAFGATLKEFAITLSSSVIISGIVSLTLTPAISARFLSHSTLADKLLAPIEKAYGFLLKKAMKLKQLFSIFAVISILGSFYIANNLPKENVPKGIVREIDIYSVSSGNKHLQFFKKKAKFVSDFLKNQPDIENFSIYMQNSISINIKMKKNKSIKETSDKIMKFLKYKVKDINFVQKSSKASNSFDIYVFGNLTRTEIQYIGNDLCNKLRDSKLINHAIQYSVSKIGYNLEIDYQKAALIGCDIHTLEKVIEIFNTRYHISTLEANGKRFQIIALSDKEDNLQQSLQNIWHEQTRDKSLIISPSVFTKLVKQKQINSVNNFNGFPAFKIEISGTSSAKMSELIEDINKIHKKFAGNNTEISFTGKAKEFLENQGEMQKMFILAAVFIFLILLAQFENLKSTLIVMLTAPLAIFGSLLVIKGKGSINIYSTIALITLIGLITKHGILFINGANINLEKGLSKEEASFLSATERIRPVLMTTLAMFLGLLPLLIENDPDMIILNQMVIVLVPGLIFGTLMTLFVIPCVFLL